MCINRTLIDFFCVINLMYVIFIFFIQVLKWLVEFSEKMEKRAKSTAAELNGLLDQARVVELDMKNTINSFNSLCHQRFIDHASKNSNWCFSLF